MPNFTERLRMGNIYGGNPFSPREESPMRMLDQFIRRLPPEQTVLQPMQQPEPEIRPELRQAFAVGMSPYQEATIEQRRREMESKERLAGETQDIRRSELDIRQQRANVYDYKAKNPSSKFVINKATGNMTAVNPITGETVRDFGRTQLGQEELINLNQENAIARIEEGGEQARETEKERQKGRESLADINARHRRELEEFKASQGSKTAELPSQKKNQLELNYNILINRRPDLRKLVKRDTATGEITVATPEDSPGNEIDIDYINKFLFGTPSKDVKLPGKDDKKDTTVKPSTTTPKDTTGEAPKAPAGWKYVRKADGKGWTAVKVE